MNPIPPARSLGPSGLLLLGGLLLAGGDGAARAETMASIRAIELHSFWLHQHRHERPLRRHLLASTAAVATSSFPRTRSQ